MYVELLFMLLKPMGGISIPLPLSPATKLQMDCAKLLGSSSTGPETEVWSSAQALQGHQGEFFHLGRRIKSSMEMVGGLTHLLYKDRLRELGSFCLEKAARTHFSLPVFKRGFYKRVVPDLEVVALPVAGGLELDDPWDPLQPKPFYDLVILWSYSWLSGISWSVQVTAQEAQNLPCAFCVGALGQCRALSLSVFIQEHSGHWLCSYWAVRSFPLALFPVFFYNLLELMIFCMILMQFPVAPPEKVASGQKCMQIYINMRNRLQLEKQLIVTVNCCPLNVEVLQLITAWGANALRYSRFGWEQLVSFPWSRGAAAEMHPSEAIQLPSPWTVHCNFGWKSAVPFQALTTESWHKPYFWFIGSSQSSTWPFDAIALCLLINTMVSLLRWQPISCLIIRWL